MLDLSRKHVVHLNEEICRCISSHYRGFVSVLSSMAHSWKPQIQTLDIDWSFLSEITSSRQRCTRGVLGVQKSRGAETTPLISHRPLSTNCYSWRSVCPTGSAGLLMRLCGKGRVSEYAVQWLEVESRQVKSQVVGNKGHEEIAVRKGTQIYRD